MVQPAMLGAFVTTSPVDRRLILVGVEERM